MRDAETHPLHRLDHHRRRRRATGRDFDDVIEAALHTVRCMHEHVQDDRRAAEMRDPVLGDRGKDGCRIDPAQTDMRAGDRRHRPGIGPAVAVEHRQCPEIDRMPVDPEGDRVAERVQIGAAMVVDDAFRIAGRARGVVERDRRPFVRGP